jgi:hypothetical protein
MFQETFKALAALPVAVVGEIAGLVGRIVGGIEKVINTGITETFGVHFTVLGRRVGIEVKIALLDKPA